VWLDEQCLILNNIVDNLDRTSIENYLRDFQQDLIWLILGFGGAAATSKQNVMSNTEIVAALEDFAAASRQVLSHPAQQVQEILVKKSPTHLRPNISTFRDYLRNPSAQRLTSRGAQETPNIADNRYLHHM